MDWEKVETLYPKGKRLSVTITRVEHYGAFVDLPDGVPGYIPAKELSWTGSILDAREKLSEGHQVDTLVLGIDRRHRSVVLSVREVMGNPWPNFRETHKKGDILKGQVIRVLERAAFLEIDGVIQGLIPLSHIWISVERMEEALLVGDQVRARILEFEDDEQLVVLSTAALFKEEKKSIDPESGLSIGEALQDAFDLLKFNLERETERDIGLSEEAKAHIKRILVVDPDAQLGLSTAMMLESVGSVADYTTSAEEAITKFDEQAYDFVLTVMSMPGVDGINLTRTLHKNNPQLPIVIQTAREDIEHHLDRLKNAGLQNCILTKPWKLADLVEVINEAAEGTFGQRPLRTRAMDDFGFIDRISRPAFEQTETKGTIEEILEELKKETHASFVVVFELQLTTLETNILAEVGLEKELSERDRDLLRFSQIIHVIHGGTDLKDDFAKGRKYEHLRPLGTFSSVIGQQIDFTSAWGYGLFLFGEQEYQFTSTDLDNAKIAARILGAAIERRTLEEIYKTRHKLIIAGQLSSALIHELKNEQQALFNYIDVLKTDSVNLNAGKIKADDTQFLARFQRVVNALFEEQDKMQAIQRLFLNLLKERDEEEIELSEHLTKLAMVIKPIADKVKVEIIPPKRKIRKCWLNISRFDQVITNLLMNAVDQIPLVREISGKAWMEVNFVEDDDLPIKVTIRDNGPGIHTVHLKRVFDIFFTTKKGGSGLGLFISQALVDSLGGRISIKDTIRFGGTTLLVELPVAVKREGK